MTRDEAKTIIALRGCPICSNEISVSIDWSGSAYCYPCRRWIRSYVIGYGPTEEDLEALIRDIYDTR